LDVHLLGIGYQRPVRDFGGATLHPTNLRGGDVFGAFAAAELVDELDARIVLLFHDFWMLHPHARTLAGSRATVVAYVAVDGRIVDERFLEPLGSVDHFVAYTEFGRRELERFVDVPVAVIPHGVDTDVFRPADSRPDGFVVLNANRPHERKRIDLTIEGFEMFARDKPPDVRLRLHHAIDAAEYDLTDRVEVTSSCLSDADLNRLYNECHVGVNTAMGEGWGLISFEHAATGAAQVVPDSSACSELWAGAAEIVPAEDTGVPAFSPLAMRTVSAEGVAAAFERLYADAGHLRAMSDAAWRNATQPRYSWDVIGEQWLELLDEVAA
jgi:glycosyltransferase involved in cell wall biosynthesis